MPIQKRQEIYVPGFTLVTGNLYSRAGIGSASPALREDMQGGGSGGGLSAFEQAEADIEALGPLAWWKFDDGSGQQVTDYSGNGFHLQLGSTSGVDLGEPEWQSYGIDKIISGSQNHLRANSDLGISGADPRTVVAVVQIDTAFSGQTGCTFFTWCPAAPGTGERWSLRNESSDPTLRLESGGGGNNSQSFTGLDFADETWSFIAATQSGAATNTAVGYKDGSAVAYTNVGTNINTTGNLGMMCQEVLSAGEFIGTSRWGKIAYGLVFDTALSAENIETIRTALITIMADRGITLP